jgi:hypothetical protein
MDERLQLSDLRTRSRALAAWFWLATLQGILILTLHLRTPSQAENSILFGLSAQRLVLAAVYLAATLPLLGLGWRALRRPVWTHHMAARLGRWLERPFTTARLGALCLFAFIAGAYLILLIPEVTEPYTHAIFERLLPGVAWLTGLSLQSLFLLPFLRTGGRWRARLRPGKTLSAALLIWGTFLLLWGLFAWSRLGLNVDPTGWNAIGAPILDTQVFLAWLAGLVFLVVGGWGGRLWPVLHKGRVRLDLVLGLLLWTIAALYWSLVPLPASWFVTEPVPPNFSYYPNSDALIYDTTGQSMLVGEMYKSWDQPFPRRPMYALFLATLQTLGGQDYQAAARMQVLVLAIFPVLMYAMVSLLHNRLSGMIAAALVVLREGTGIALSGNITISHSRLFMTDFPNALGVLLFAWLVTRWLVEPDQRIQITWLAGGVLGTFVLIRPEVMILLPALFTIVVLVLYRRWRSLVLGSAAILIGLIAVISPWVWRNYQVAGSLFLERPGHRLDFLFERLEDTPSLESSGGLQTPVTVLARYAPQTLPAPANQSVPRMILNHYAHSNLQMVLLLPATSRLPDSLMAYTGHGEFPRFWQACCSAIEYTRRLPFWDNPWQGGLLSQSIIPVLFNLFLLAVGLAVAWRRRSWVGLLPLAFSQAYLLINAIARTSGGRYIQSAEWASVVYFSIGLGAMTLWGLRQLLGVNLRESLLQLPEWRPMVSPGLRRRRFAGHGMLMVLVLVGFGSLLPLSEGRVPQRYTPVFVDALITALQPETQVKGIDLVSLQSNGGELLAGRALYPRFYPAGFGAPGNPQTDTWAGMAKPSFYSEEFRRTSFYLAGPRNASVLLPIIERTRDFPHAADVIVAGCPGEEYFDALVVGVFDEAGALKAVYWRDPAPSSLACPFAPPE